MLLALAFIGSEALASQTRVCETYAPPRRSGLLRHAPLDESSGIVASRTRDGLYYSHNDSGSGPEVFAFTADGGLDAVSTVEGVGAFDWEDIAAGSCPGGGDCLFLGDIGDNDHVRSHVEVFAIAEPLAAGVVPTVATWRLRYPERARNSEALLVHPTTGRLYVITKNKRGPIKVYAGPAEPGEANLIEVGTLWELPSGSSRHKVTGADWSADGLRVVVRTYSAAWEWTVPEGATEPDWSAEPRRVQVAAEAQGEAIGYRPEGGLITTSEGQPMPISLIDCAP